MPVYTGVVSYFAANQGNPLMAIEPNWDYRIKGNYLKLEYLDDLLATEGWMRLRTEKLSRLYRETLTSLADTEHRFVEFDLTAPERMRPFLSDPESGIEACPLGLLHPGENISSTESSNVYRGIMGDDGEPVVVKYAHDCLIRMGGGGITSQQHPLFVDALFLSALQSTGVVPSLIHLSAPAPLGPQWTRSLGEKWDACVAAGTQVRFLVTEPAGLSLAAYIHWASTRFIWSGYAKRIMRLTTAVLELLYKIHKKGVIHGNVHASNILFRAGYRAPEDVSPYDIDLVLIDFKHATFFPLQQMAGTKEIRRVGGNRVQMSPWQLTGWRTGRRDDLFGALEIMTNGLLRGKWERSLTRHVASFPSGTSEEELDAIVADLKMPNRSLLEGISFMERGHKWDAARDILQWIAGNITVTDPNGLISYRDLEWKLEDLRQLF